MLLLHPCHNIKDLNALQMNDLLKLTTVSNYNTLVSDRKRKMMQHYQNGAPRSNADLFNSKDKVPGYVNVDYSNGIDNANILPPLVHSGKAPQILHASTSEINRVMMEDTNNMVKAKTP